MERDADLTSQSINYSFEGTFDSCFIHSLLRMQADFGHGLVHCIPKKRVANSLRNELGLKKLRCLNHVFVL
jgi:hypothetical protein